MDRLDQNVPIKLPLYELAQNTRELYLPTDVQTLDKPPSPLVFLRDWVNRNVPFKVHDACKHWPAFSKWNPDYFRSMFSDKELSVAVTPNGYADAVLGNNFVMPEERKMAFSHFLDIIDKKVEANGVFYIQKQNSNLTEEFPELLGDVDADIGWATEAFGKRPDAVNFWMGEEQAISSLHKDPYENLYYVISGSKTFTLIPPTDRPFIPYKNYQPAEYHEDSATGKWEVVTKHGLDQVPWIPVDPLNPDVERFPQYADANVVTVTVNAGEMLYLPSLWFHHVMQSHGCIAVNYWYDMDYDMKYCYYELLNSLTQTLEEL